MSSGQRYERVAHDDNDTRHSPIATIPSSPPPSFRSRSSSRRRGSREGQTQDERELNDAFDAPSDSDDDDDDGDDAARSQRRLISRTSSQSGNDNNDTTTYHSGDSRRPDNVQRQVTEIPVFAPITPSGRVYGGGNAADGVWANLAAKPQVGDDAEEKPPTYEQAAADATPPYWETTVFSPYAYTGNPDDVFVDGLLVGSFFSFIWNALISLSFQPLIGFLLTYLLHTTHAAKHGSRAGLGATLVQWGFQMRYSTARAAPQPGPRVDGIPSDPNAHDFDPDVVTGVPSHGLAGMSYSDWIAYASMILGWFILIRAFTDFLRARRQEALIRSSPDRGLGTAVVADNEHPESSV